MSSPALEQVVGRLMAALEQQGKTGIADGRFLGMALFLSRWLRQLGCQQISEATHVINFFADTPKYRAGVEDTIRGVAPMGTLLVKMRLATEQEVRAWGQQIRADLASPDFVGMAFYVSAWRRKPLSGT